MANIIYNNLSFFAIALAFAISFNQNTVSTASSKQDTLLDCEDEILSKKNQDWVVKSVIYVNNTRSIAAELFADNPPKLNFNGDISLHSGNISNKGPYAISNRSYRFSVEEFDKVWVTMGLREQPRTKVDANKVVIGAGRGDTKLDLGKIDQDIYPEAAHRVWVMIGAAPVGNPYKEGVLTIPSAGEGPMRGDISAMLPQRTIMVYELRDRQNNLLRKYTFSVTSDQDFTVTAEGPTGPAAVTVEHEKVGANHYVVIRTIRAEAEIKKKK